MKMKKIPVYLLLTLLLLQGFMLTANAAPESNDVRGFVERLYETCLNRDSDEDGLNYWVGLLTSETQTAAEVVSGFYNSKEYIGSGASNTDFVESLYYTMMNRQSDSDGIAYWLSLLQTGVSKDYVIMGFVGSQEFSAICTQYGVSRGSIALSEARDQNIDTTKFVRRLYQTCLGRTVDIEGLNYWCQLVNEGSVSGAGLVKEFFESTEYQNQNNENPVFIEDLYLTVLDRSYDSSGMSYWMTQLSYGVPRQYVIKQFCESEEFTLLCAQYGIGRGTIEITDPDLINLNTSAAVVKLVNEEREKNGVEPLVWDADLAAAALERARELEITFSHIRPNGSWFFNVLYDFDIDFGGAGENIAQAQSSAEEVMEAWMDSPGHKANILKPSYTKIGVGHYQDESGIHYWTQLFIY